MHNPNKVGVVGAVLLAGWHAVWSVLVLAGVAQSIYDFVLWAHMLHLPLIVGPFDATAAASLIVITAIMGYVIGYSAAWVWNRFHR